MNNDPVSGRTPVVGNGPDEDDINDTPPITVVERDAKTGEPLVGMDEFGTMIPLGARKAAEELRELREAMRNVPAFGFEFADEKKLSRFQKFKQFVKNL